MRVSQQEKDRSHARIVDKAARLMRARGFEGASVGDVMKEAGLTHGGFYRHFDSKEGLMASALETAFDEILSLLESAQDNREPADAVLEFENFYLSDRHVLAAERGCPVAALGGEIGRQSKTLKAAFGAGLRRTIAALANGSIGAQEKREKAAIRRFAMMAGAVMIARASDKETSQMVLAACRD